MKKEDLYKRITYLYSELGWNQSQIARELGRSSSGIQYIIKNVLKLPNNNLKRNEKIRELYVIGNSPSQIAKKLGMSKNGVTYILNNELNIQTNRTKGDYDYRKYKVNDVFFEKIDSEAKAYLLGFLYADGNVGKNGNTINVCIHKKDVEILNFFKKEMDFQGEYHPYKDDYLRLTITSQKIHEDLIKQGCVPNKTFLLTFPDISEDFVRDFIRGYFDGDGSVWKNKFKLKDGTMSYSLKGQFIGTEEFLTELGNKLPIATGELRHVNKEKNNICRLDFCGKDKIKILYNYLYDNSRLYLKRKRDIFEEYINKCEKEC